MSFLFKKNGPILNFWPVHLLTWLTFSVIDLSINISRFKDITDSLVWFDSNLVGFFIVTSLRYIYQKLFASITVYYKQIGVAILLSLAGGIVWFFFRGLSHIIIFPAKAISFSNYYRVFTVPFGITFSVFWLVGPIFGWSLGYLSIKNYFFLIDERDRNQKIQILAKNAQLQMLRYQINPHFLFNSLNSVKALISENPETAEKTLTALSEFLQATLKYNERLLIPVEEERAIICKYLIVEKVRYESRLIYSVKADESILTKEVPCFITQPLVENAVKHGLLNAPKGMKLSINYTSAGSDSILIEVINSGILKKNWSIGIGLSNLLERLETSYPGMFTFSINQVNENVVASILINLEE
jgi:two-component system LytT family sensor kinase